MIFFGCFLPRIFIYDNPFSSITNGSVFNRREFTMMFTKKFTDFVLVFGISNSFLFGATALAETHGHDKSHGKGHGKGHAAHEHGAAKLNLVAEGNKLTAQFEAPSASIYGFEYEPKTAADKKKREAGGEKLTANIEKMIILDAKLGCKFKSTKLDLHSKEAADEEEADAKKTEKPKSSKDQAKRDAEHSETHAEFVAECSAPLAGTKVTFGFSKFFPKVRSLTVQALSGEKQAGAEISKDKGSVEL